MEQIWKPIDGYNGIYEISNLGRIRSLDRNVFNKGNGSYCFKSGRELKPNKDRGGYLYVGLYDSENIRTNSIKIHRLVALSFVSGFEEGLHVNHIDGVRHNNVFSNLEWVTPSVNNKHRFVLGYKMPANEEGHASKLKNEYIPFIVNLYTNGVSQSIIAKSLGVSQGTISNVINSKHYKDYEKGLAISIHDLKQ